MGRKMGGPSQENWRNAGLTEERGVKHVNHSKKMMSQSGIERGEKRGGEKILRM